MDRRVFEPRPTGSETRRRNALSMALIVLAALAFWQYTLRMNSHPAPGAISLEKALPPAQVNEKPKEKN